MAMRILHVVPTAEEEASGPAYSVPRLARAMADLGEEVALFSLSTRIRSPRGLSELHTEFPRDYGRTPAVRSLWLSQTFARQLRKEATTRDVIHVNGLWVMPAVYPGLAARDNRVSLVASPRGTLSPVALARSSLRKKLFWLVAQRAAVKRADCLHATSEQELADIRAAGLNQPVALVPNGIDLPAAARRLTCARRRLLYLGRIHPIKGLEPLLQAWALLEESFPDWELRLVGPDEGGHQAKLQGLADRLALKRVTFAGSKYGASKLAEYEAAELYVLPSFSENFGMSVAEALASGLPVVTTTGTPWRALTDNGCGWCVAPKPGELATALAEGMRLPRRRLETMGEAGRAWMLRDFSWEGVATQMLSVYRWLRASGDKPMFVRLDA